MKLHIACGWFEGNVEIYSTIPSTKIEREPDVLEKAIASLKEGYPEADIRWMVLEVPDDIFERLYVVPTVPGKVTE